MVVFAARDVRVRRELDLLLSTVGIALIPVTVQQAKIASEAYRDFGRSSGHPARLHFGDCFSYALAKVWESPFCSKVQISDLRTSMQLPCEQLVKSHTPESDHQLRYLTGHAP